MNDSMSSSQSFSHIRLLKGQLIRDVIDDVRYRLLYIPDNDENNGYWINVDSNSNIPKAFSVPDVKLRLGTQRYEAVLDTFVHGDAGSDPSPVSIGIRDRAYSLIKDIVSVEPDVYTAQGRAALLRKQSEKTGVKPTNLYGYLGKYWRGGMSINALMPDLSMRGRGRKEGFVAQKRLGRPKKAGNNGKILVQTDYENFAKAIEVYYHVDTKPTLHDAYDAMLAHMYVKPHFTGDTAPEMLDPDDKPSFTQFYYWYRKNRNPVEEKKARETDGRYELKFRAETGKTETCVKGPGLVAQIDATIADYYIVRENDRNGFIGRPVMFFVKDARTRMITGMHVTIENTSYDQALMALKNTAEDKVEYCRRYGVQITPDEWPCHCLPASITADNGEMGDKGIEEVIAKLGITIENTPPYRGDLKAIIENNFNLIDMKLRYIVPGHVDKDAGQRGSIDRKESACMDLRTFTRLIIKCVLFYNNYWYMESYQKSPLMRSYGVKPIPRELWNYGMQFESGAMKTLSKEEIYRVLLPKETASVTEKGIFYNDLYYTCPLAEEQQWFSKARIDGRWTVPITYDPTCVDHIYLPLDKDTLVECSLLSRVAAYSGATEEDMRFYHDKDAQEKADYAQTLEQAKTELRLETEKIVERCRKEKSDAGKEAVAGALKRNHVRTQREKEQNHISGKEQALAEQEAYFSSSNIAYASSADAENPTADTAIDKSIDKALEEAMRDAGF